MLRFFIYALMLGAALAAPAFAQDNPTVTTAPATVPVTPSDEAAISDEGTISPEVQAVINTPQPPADTAADITPPGAPPPPVTDAVEPKAPEYEDMPQVELRILDKVRAESRTYVLNVGRTVAYANIRIRPRACRKSSPLDDPENAAFLQIWEVKPDASSAWIFSGWMFASSPSLSGMDHPVYDVTVLDCKNPDSESQSDSAATTSETGPTDDSELFTNESVEDDDSAAPSKE